MGYPLSNRLPLLLHLLAGRGGILRVGELPRLKRLEGIGCPLRNRFKVRASCRNFQAEELQKALPARARFCLVGFKESCRPRTSTGLLACLQMTGNVFPSQGRAFDHIEPPKNLCFGNRGENGENKVLIRQVLAQPILSLKAGLIELARNPRLMFRQRSFRGDKPSSKESKNALVFVLSQGRRNQTLRVLGSLQILVDFLGGVAKRD